MIKIIISILSISASCLFMSAADNDSVNVVRPVTSAYTVGAGSSHLADTYLTPLKYTGWHVALGYERMQAMKFSPDKWVMQLAFNLNADRTRNPARNATMWYWGLDFSWSMMRRWHLPYGFTVGVGGMAMLDAGCLYSTRNGNNPASAKGAVTVGATGYAAWNGNLWRLPVTVRYQPSLPVIGAFFSPDYGELYYEIYLGNRSGLVHCAWWGNYFRMKNLLTVDLHFGGTSLRLGYAADILSTQVNHITTNIINHTAVIGVSGEWLSVNPRKPLSRNARMVSALF